MSVNDISNENIQYIYNQFNLICYPFYTELNYMNCDLDDINLDCDLEDAPFTRDIHCSTQQSMSHLR